MKSTEKEYWQLVWDKFRKGDQDAFNTIYNEFVDALFAYGSKITSDTDLLKDSIQDLFIDIYTYGAKLRQPELLEYYLFKSLKKTIIKELKENQRFTSIKANPENYYFQGGYVPVPTAFTDFRTKFELPDSEKLYNPNIN